MKLKICVFIVFVGAFQSSYVYSEYENQNQLSTFKIVFVSDASVASNTDWLNRVTKEWGATGICIRIFWGHVDTDLIPGADNWINVDKAINTIASYKDKKLDIYLRICMGLQKPEWVSPLNSIFSKDDFQIKYDNSLYDHQAYEEGIPESERYPLNFNSPNSADKMKSFLREVLEHINTSFSDNIKNRIIEVVPTFSVADEEEYPFAEMCGYSSYENSAFRLYLINKYHNRLSDLNKKWNPDKNWKNFDDWEKIIPANYNWHSYNNYSYKYPNGRVDWINFRTEQLSSFINSLNEIAFLYDFKVGIQIGSIYDDLVEKRGWVDPTKLFEKVNSAHIAEIFQYSQNFSFAADYLRSICMFWTVTNNMIDEPINFSTETNWPGFFDQSPSFLSQKWKEQLITYYKRGASANYLVGWDISIEKLDSCKTLYEDWRYTLLKFSDRKVIKIVSEEAVHLSTEQIFYNHNHKSLLNGRFELYNSIISQALSSSFRAYMDKQNIITNYMIEKNPKYLNNYLALWFNKSSKFITEKAYSGLLNDSIKAKYVNTTLSDVDTFRDEYIPGIRNEYNQNRVPAQLLSRSISYSEFID